MDLPMDLASLLRREDDSVEWKQTGDARDVVKKLTAFANRPPSDSRGGWVICGCGEEKDEHGFQRAVLVGLTAAQIRSLKGKVLDACRKFVAPPIYPTPFEETVPAEPSRRVLVFYVGPSEYAHAWKTPEGSKYYVAQDSSTVEAHGAVLQKLLRDKKAVPPLLSRPCFQATIDDINPLAAEEFLLEARLPRPVARYLEPDARLDAFSHPLVVSVEVAPEVTRPVPTYLSLLLFSREPTQFLPGAYAVLTAYDGVSRSEAHSRRFDTAGPLPKLIRDLLEKLRLYTGVDIDKSASALSSRQNRRRYSEKALQEAVVNAFAHRDYESHEPVRITVFEDRIEISNPGGLLPGVDRELLLRGEVKAPEWRNPALASFLLRMSLAQHLGQGIPTIREETLAVADRPPEILPGTESFTVILPAPAAEPEAESGDSSEDGLILVTIGAESVRSMVEESLDDLGLREAKILVDLDIPRYVQPGAWEREAKRIRAKVRRWVDDPRFKRLHLFYRGPVVLAPLLGALIVPAKPLVVYYFEGGRYERAYTLERRFLISKD
jgi:ATP-dependent DNA helicase RecG